MAGLCGRPLRTWTSQFAWVDSASGILRSVSREAVEIVQRIYDAVARRDTATVMSLYHQDIEWDDSQLPEAELTDRTGVVRGRDAIRDLFRDWYEAWESFEDHCDEVIDAGEQVISIVTRRGRGRASGALTSSRRAGVWTVRDRQVVSVVWFPTREEALQAIDSRP
jgi:ketosteroid isomerase-like protein